jgi:hypothetical protein
MTYGRGSGIREIVCFDDGQCVNARAGGVVMLLSGFAGGVADFVRLVLFRLGFPIMLFFASVCFCHPPVFLDLDFRGAGVGFYGSDQPFVCLVY